jgi:hypothetical protein
MRKAIIVCLFFCSVYCLANYQTFYDNSGIDAGKLNDIIRSLDDKVRYINDNYLSKTTASTTYLTTSYVDRGDVANADYTEATLTTNGAWHDLNLGTICPVGTKAILIELTIKDDAIGSYLQLRPNGYVNASNTSIIRVQVANLFDDKDAIISCDSNRVIEYWASNTTFTNIYVTVKGYWK